MIFSIFTELCNHLHDQRTFLSLEKKPQTLQLPSSDSPTP